MEILNKYKEYLIARNQSMVYYNFIKTFLAYCEKNHVDYNNITQETITLFFNSNKYSSNSKNNFIKAGRSFYGFLNTPEDKNEWFKITLLKVDRKIPTYLSEEDLRACIKYLNTYSSNIGTSEQKEALLFFMFYTGARKGEILSLHRKDINLEECSVKLWGQKSKQDRIVYFSVKVKNRLVDYFNKEQETINAFNTTRMKIDYLIHSLNKYFPGKKISPHTFRHSFGRNLVEKGIPLGIISKQMGHSSINTTLIYTDPNEETIKKIMKDKIN